jgi:DNA-binding beta-propeller fold protein YncE
MVVDTPAQGESLRERFEAASIAQLSSASCVAARFRRRKSLGGIVMSYARMQDVPTASWLCVSICAAVVSTSTALAAPRAGESFTAFESGQVRPVALARNGDRLFVANTPDNRVEIFRVDDSGLEHEASVVVGLEPVAIAARNDREIWVVNHLSDSVSIVDVSDGAPPRVAATLLVGDEPRDIVFANDRAFITTAHRGQNSRKPFRPLVTEGRADVWAVSGTSRAVINVVTLFGDTPRALAVSPDGRTVYAGIFNSGNRTTILSRNTVRGALPPPLTNAEGDLAPLDVGLIVHYDGENWLDGAGRIWNNAVRMSLPDYDVFAIDAQSTPPAETARYSGVGTTLFNIAVNPVSGVLYVSNTEAHNDVRFEGPGDFGGSTVRGHFVDSRISVIDDGDVRPRHLNKHIDYEQFPGTPEENEASLAQPLQMVVSGDGETLYLAAFGSSKVGIFDTQELENDEFVPSPDAHVELSAGGPSGLALDEARGRLYVLTRFDNGISVVDIDALSPREISHVKLYNPEPPEIVNGRPFLYDARHTSSRGDSSCGGCHVFGDTDHLAWDLGNPDGTVADNPNPLRLPLPPRLDNEFHPMKGPMMTQSLRGMAGNGPMHWRGDRTGGHQGGDPLDENAAFVAFNVAFEGLLGRTAPLSSDEMQAFADFALLLTYPPNPIRSLDNSRSGSEQIGFEIFENEPTDQSLACGDCHVLNPSLGFFGTRGLTVVRTGPTGDANQPLKIPHLRNLYTKIGFFGASRERPGELDLGDQIRGFGYLHDGSEDTLLSFLDGFTLPPGPENPVHVLQFLLSMDSNLAPVVGQQVTLGTETPFTEVRQRLLLLLARSDVVEPVPECDLVVKGTVDGEQRGWLRVGDGEFQSDRLEEPRIGMNDLRTLSMVPGQDLTITCVPPGSGTRIALDRDSDGYYDRDELDAGSDPADPGSIPPPKASDAGRAGDVTVAHATRTS